MSEKADNERSKLVRMPSDSMIPERDIDKTPYSKRATSALILAA